MCITLKRNDARSCEQLPTRLLSVIVTGGVREGVNCREKRKGTGSESAKQRLSDSVCVHVYVCVFEGDRKREPGLVFSV